VSRPSKVDKYIHVMLSFVKIEYVEYVLIVISYRLKLNYSNWKSPSQQLPVVEKSRWVISEQALVGMEMKTFGKMEYVPSLDPSNDPFCKR
jgi:hypothetical protein